MIWKINTKFNIGDVSYFIRDNRIYNKLNEDLFISNVELFEPIIESKVQLIVTKSFKHLRSSSINQSIDYHLKGEYLVNEKNLFSSRKEVEKYLMQEQMKYIETLQNKINDFNKRK